MKKKQVKKAAEGIKVKTGARAGSLMNELMDEKSKD
jgi:hypothetical protein